MATDNKTAHTYAHTVHTLVRGGRPPCLSHAALCFPPADVTKAHYLCDTLAGSVMQTECQADAAALTSPFRLCQQLFELGQSTPSWSSVSVEAAE